jgi:hypothetical protein
MEGFAAELLMEEAAVELVHRVQQERGITCGWVAGCGSLDYFGSRLAGRHAHPRIRSSDPVPGSFTGSQPIR